MRLEFALPNRPERLCSLLAFLASRRTVQRSLCPLPARSVRCLPGVGRSGQPPPRAEALRLCAQVAVAESPLRRLGTVVPPRQHKDAGRSCRMGPDDYRGRGKFPFKPPWQDPIEADTPSCPHLLAQNPFARHREKAVLGSSPISPVTSPLLDGLRISGSSGSGSTSYASDAPHTTSPTLLSPTSFAPPPPPPTAPPPRHPGRPAPPSLAVRSQTLPHPVSPAMSVSSSLDGSSTASNLSRHNTVVVKPDSRQWGAMGEEERHEWLRASERAAKMTKTPLVDLSR